MLTHLKMVRTMREGKRRGVKGMQGYYLRLLPGLCLEFKIAAGNVIRMGEGEVMKYTYIPTGNKRELVRFGMDYNYLFLAPP